MAEAVAGLLTSAVVNIAKAKLASAIGEQANLLWNFDGDLEEMDTLTTISAALEDAERRSVKESLVRVCLKQLKHAALDISDVLGDYQVTCSDQATTKMRVLSCLPMACKKITLANRMKTERENLSKISKRFEGFKFIITHGTNTTTSVQQCDKRETTSYLPEQPIIARDVEKQGVINLLSANNNANEVVIVPIYGLGGMGKSTLAQLVYNDDDQFKKYDHRVWVYVSQDFSLLKIGCSIISQLPAEGGQHNMDTVQVVKNRLSEILHGKKVLVVLWEEQRTELDKLKCMLYVEGSMIHVIVTTRKEDIARKLSTSEPYKLQPLEDGLCWEIIKRFSKFELKSNKENLERIGFDIAKKCGGVALAAQAIGYRLQSTNDPSGWIKINNSDV